MANFRPSDSPLKTQTLQLDHLEFRGGNNLEMKTFSVLQFSGVPKVTDHPSVITLRRTCKPFDLTMRAIENIHVPCTHNRNHCKFTGMNRSYLNPEELAPASVVIQATVTCRVPLWSQIVSFFIDFKAAIFTLSNRQTVLLIVFIQFNTENSLRTVCVKIVSSAIYLSRRWQQK